MRVNQTGSSPAQAAETSGAKKTDKASEKKDSSSSASAAAAALTGDSKTDISAKARDLAKAQDLAHATSDVREEKIAELACLVDGNDVRVIERRSQLRLPKKPPAEVRVLGERR